MENDLKKIQSEDRLPGEVVEEYRRKDFREVVEVYRRPLPGQSGRSGEKKRVPTLPVKRRKTGLWIFLACFGAVVVLTAAALIWQGTAGYIQFGSFELPFGGREVSANRNQEITIPTWPVGQGAALTLLRERDTALSAQEVYRQVNPAVVSVMVQCGNMMSMGTGVLFTTDGYLLTNYHVVAGGENCGVVLESGETYQANYVAGDIKSDLAILKIDGKDLPAASFGDSDLLVVGDPVYAIGTPMGYELWGTLTDGIVSALDREVEVDGRYMTLIQTNAALNTGNSGGPLINEYGQVVGLNVIKMSSSEESVEGLGFAIPTATIDRVANDLLTYGEVKPEPLLGLSAEIAATELAEGLWGLEVVSILEGGSAEQAGIQVGDYLIAADGEPLLSSKDLLRMRRQHYLGEEMVLTLWRNGITREVVLELTQAAE